MPLRHEDAAVAAGAVMKSFIERQLYQPALVLPMVDLMQLMVSLDFNMGQIGLMVATRGARAALARSREFWCATHGCAAPGDSIH
jgi:hypothetical protein